MGVPTGNEAGRTGRFRFFPVLLLLSLLFQGCDSTGAGGTPVGSVAGKVPRSWLDNAGMTLTTFVRDGVAFLGDALGGVPIVDVRIPSAPVLLHIVEPLSPGAKSYRAWCTEDGNYLVIANNIDGALFYDITVKSAPVLRHQAYQVDNAIGGFASASLPGYPYPVSAGMNVLYPLSVTGSGNVAYVGGRDALVVFDITNRAAPAQAGSFHVSGEGSDLAVRGNRLYFASDTVEIYDISSPLVPVHLGSHPWGGAGVASNGNIMAVSHIADGLEFVDVSNPSAPVSFTTFPVTTQGVDASAAGDFYAATADSMTAYRVTGPRSVEKMYSAAVVEDYAMNVAVSGEYAYVSDKTAGLKIVRIR